MQWVGPGYFYLCGFFAVLGALIAIVAANPIRGAMGLLLMILSVAGLFLALHAQFLAAIQLIVYAGAVVVLFLFVIMLLGPASQAPRDHRGRITRMVGGGLFFFTALITMLMAARSLAKPPALPMADADFGSIDAFGRVLFNEGLVPFELSSALLLVSVIGAVAIARGKQGEHRLPAEQTGNVGGRGAAVQGEVVTGMAPLGSDVAARDTYASTEPAE